MKNEENVNNIEKCQKGEHSFEVISYFSWGNESKVVRWCTECGAIVVDLDHDGRTSPGYYKKLRYPNIVHRNGLI